MKSKFVFVWALTLGTNAFACPDFGTKLMVRGEPMIPGVEVRTHANGGARLGLSMDTTTKTGQKRKDYYSVYYNKEKGSWYFKGAEGEAAVRDTPLDANGLPLSIKLDDRKTAAQSCLYVVNNEMMSDVLVIYTPKDKESFKSGCPKYHTEAELQSAYATYIKPTDLHVEGSRSFAITPVDLRIKIPVGSPDRTLGTLRVHGNTKLMSRGITAKSVSQDGPYVSFSSKDAIYQQSNCGGAKRLVAAGEQQSPGTEQGH